MTELKIECSLKRDNLYLFKIPLLYNWNRVCSIYTMDGDEIIELDLDLSQINWEILEDGDIMRMCFMNFPLAIYARYSKKVTI